MTDDQRLAKLVALRPREVEREARRLARLRLVTSDRPSPRPEDGTRPEPDRRPAA